VVVVSRVRGAAAPMLLGIAGYYALFGGEYSIFEVRSARAAVDVERAELVSVTQRIDSLRAWADSLENDLPTIERVARERFGMIRDGETLYRFVPADSVPDGERDPER
jgi:cell division protein FtsB